MTKKIIILPSLLVLALISMILPSVRPKKDLILGVNVVENLAVLERARTKEFDLSDVWYYFSYGDSYDVRKTLHKVRYMGANTVGLLYYGWMNDPHATGILFDSSRAEGLREAIGRAHDDGLKVVLRPTIELKSVSDGMDWRGSIIPADPETLETDWAAWFESYRKFILFAFDIAIETNVEIFSVGIELHNSFEGIDHWNRLMAELRAKSQASGYKGKLMYQANTYRGSELWQMLRLVSLGNQEMSEYFGSLDYLGLSVYDNFISEGKDIAEIRDIEASMHAFAGRIEETYKNAVRQYRMKYGLNKKVPALLVTEYGVKSTRGALKDPWRFVNSEDIYDETEQALAYQAFLNVFPGYGWFHGVLFWNMNVDPYYGIRNFVNRDTIDNGIREFTINGKEAETVVENAFYSLNSWPLSRRRMDRFLYSLYLGTALLIIIFGLHRFSLLVRVKRATSAEEAALRPALPAQLPAVTLQLPLYNEKSVAARLLQAVTGINYPRHLLEIQVLDDSTDETTGILEREIASLSADLNVKHIRRTSRDGYKAGALSNGLSQAGGEFVAIFDADFIPDPEFLNKTLPYFSDDSVGLVQSAWGYINSGSSLLTRIQKLFLDGHFYVEHLVRSRTGRFFNFNGTAGVFRKKCIEDSGGWQGDTLTEDLDLSYRAQQRGWKFVFCPDVESPSELPSTMTAFKKQQHRWTKGSVQVARKVLWSVLRQPLPVKVKTEAVFHLLCNLAYPAIWLLVLFLMPAIQIRLARNWGHSYLVDMPLLTAGSVVMVLFYLQTRLLTRAKSSHILMLLPSAMAVGIGLSINNTLAFLSGLSGKASEFVRTPKSGQTRDKDRQNWQELLKLPGKADYLVLLCELFMTLYCAHLLQFVMRFGMWASIPFILLFLTGFLYVFLATLLEITLAHIKFRKK